MADEAKLIFEFVDRGGQQNTTANLGQSGSISILGASLPADFLAQITRDGAGARAGLGSSPAGPPTPLPNVIYTPAPVDSQTRQTDSFQKSTGDSLVDDLLKADPTLTAKELADSNQGYSLADAERLLGAARGNQKETDDNNRESQPPSPTSITPTPTAYDRTIEDFVKANRRAQITPDQEHEERVNKIQEAFLRGYYQQDEMLKEIKRSESIRDSQKTEKTEHDTEPSWMQPLSSIAHGISPALGQSITHIGSLLQSLNQAQAGALGAAAGTAVGALGVNSIAGTLGGAVTGPVGMAIGASVDLAKLGQRILDSGFERAKTLSDGYSGEVNYAEAEATVRQIQSNLSTAQRLGDEVAQGISNSSRRGAAQQRILDSVSEGPLQEYNKLGYNLTRITEGLSYLINDTALGKLATDVGTSASMFAMGPQFVLLNDVLFKANKFFDTESKPKENFVEWFENLPMPGPTFENETEAHVKHESINNMLGF